MSNQQIDSGQNSMQNYHMKKNVSAKIMHKQWKGIYVHKLDF